MREQGDGGSIVNISSIDAIHPSGSGLSHYGTSKHAIWGLTKTMALELGPDGIRVNAIAPGPSLTEGAVEFVEAGAPEGIDVDAQWAAYAARIPLRRLAHPGRRRPRRAVPRLRPRLVRERRADRRRRGAARGMTHEPSEPVPRVHPRAADGRQPARVAARLDAAGRAQALAMFYEIPDGVDVPEHAHGAQWGVVLEGIGRVHDRRRDADLRPRRDVLDPGRRPAQRRHHPGYVGIDVFADADRYAAPVRQRRAFCASPETPADASGELARVDEQRAAGHQQRQVARAEEDDPGDVVGHGDPPEREARAELVERESRRLERLRAPLRGPA